MMFILLQINGKKARRKRGRSRKRKKKKGEKEGGGRDKGRVSCEP